MQLPPHYSPAIQAGKFVFTSGQLPIITKDPLKGPKSIEAQTELVLSKVIEILSNYGMDKSHIIKTTAFITNIDDWDPVNKAYVDFFDNLKPARSAIPVSKLHFGCRIELEAVAYKE